MRRLLIANRGEIAVRITRAAYDLGLDTVVACSEADRASLAARLAGRSVCIGPGPAVSSYLRPELLVHVAVATGCDAVHPGYGFLAEDPRFAAEVRRAGLAWVGPPPEVIAAMGDKARARRIAVEAGITVVPGTDGALSSAADLRAFAADHGYPVLLKARSGGGGRGMRVIDSSDDAEAGYTLAGKEAAAAFGDPGLYAERLLRGVRHVEIQVLADGTGEVVPLGERDCSVQRRHQKLLEEAPSPGLDPGVRKAMEAAAVAVARACGYASTGTVEFLVDPRTGQFFFIEMNTRIQVEHPVTEELTGVDLVAWQLRLAAGERLDIGQVQVRGHAIEFRILAEDPNRGFAPCPGTLNEFVMPSGPGVRCDSHCEPGTVVPPYYDSLLAKLIVWGADRPEALARSRRALREFRISGVPTTLELHRWLTNRPEVISGDYTTAYLEELFSTPAEKVSM